MSWGARLVGRERDLTEARAAVDAALRGEGCLVLVAGEAGVGKTRLVEAVVADAAPSVGAVWATCWDAIGAPPFWPWNQIVRDCARAAGLDHSSEHASILGPIVSGLDEVLPAAIETTATVRSEALQLRLFDEVATFLREAGERMPLIAVIDDLQWADGSSLRMLRFLAQRLRRASVAILATHRYPDVDPTGPFAAEIGDLARSARTLTLSGLTVGATRDLIRETAGSEPDEQLARLVRERTGGNPLFVTEIIRLLAAQGRLDLLADPQAAVPLPRSVRAVLEQRLRHVRPACLDVLLAASVIGEEFADQDLRLLTDPAGEELAALLDEAVRAGLLVLVQGATRRYRFNHASVRETLYEALSPARRTALHRSVAQAIEQRFAGDLDARIGELAHHYWQGGGDPRQAIGYARRAGEHALAMLAYSEAVDHFARAVQLVPHGDEDTRAEMLLRLGDARLRAGDRDGALAAHEEVTRSARRRRHGGHLAEAALGLGAGWGFEVPLFDERQLALLREALALLDPSSTALRARVLARMSVAASFIGSSEERAELSREAVRLARAAGDRHALAYALSAYSDAMSGPAHSEERVTLASEIIDIGQQTRDRELELLGRRLRLVAYLEMGDVAAVDAEIESFARVADALRMPLYLWCVPLWRGMRAIMEGRLTDAERLTAKAREIGEEANSPNAAVLADAQAILHLIESDQTQEACSRMERYLEDPDRGPNVAGILAWLLAQTGQRARAKALLRSLATNDFKRVVLEDTFALAALCFAAGAAADLEDRDAAERLRGILRPFARRFAISGIANSCMGSVSRFLGRLAHVLERWDDAEQHFRDALQDHQRAGATLLVAHTLWDRAAMRFVRRRPGDDEAAEVDAGDAIAIYSELGLHHRVEGIERWRREHDVSASVGERPNAFRREGNVWTLIYGGREARLKDSKGLNVIARLLAAPGKEFHVFDLLEPTGYRGSLRGDAETIAPEGDAGEVLDERARREYKARVAALEAELQDAEMAGDSARADKIREERDLLVEQLAAAYGLGGRVRRVGDPAERARWTIAKRIQASLKELDRSHPPLARHLQNSLRTGRFCSYVPERQTSWTL